MSPQDFDSPQEYRDFNRRHGFDPVETLTT